MAKGVIKLPGVLESDITKRFRELLKERHPLWKFVKLSILGQKDWPDYHVLVPPTNFVNYSIGCKGFYVEFKKPGETPTERQYEMLNWLTKHGFKADWFDNADQALNWIERNL